MNALVVHYSFTGTCRRVGEALRTRFDWPSGEILDARPGRGTWRCVLDSLLRRRPPIRYAGPAPEGFDMVVLVAPIWAYRLAGPMRAFVAEHRAGLRRVALVTVMGGKGAPNALSEVTRLLGRPPAMFLPLTAAEVDDGSFTRRLASFGGDPGAEPDPVQASHRPAFLSSHEA